MSTSFYCIVQSSPRISRSKRYADHLRRTVVDEFVHRSATFDILSRGGDKLGIVVNRSDGIAHYFRPLVGDVIRISRLGVGSADIEVDVYRWTGDEATTTTFSPLAVIYVSQFYPQFGTAQGLGFGPDDWVALKDAYPEERGGPKYGPTTEELTGKRDRSPDERIEDSSDITDLLSFDPRYRRLRR